MRVSERANVLVIMLGRWCGRVVLALHETRVDPDLGMLWRCRSQGLEEDLPELAILALDLRDSEDPNARELLDGTGKEAWDAWYPTEPRSMSPLLNDEENERAILNDYVQRVLSRSVAMHQLGLNWHGDLLQKMNALGKIPCALSGGHARDAEICRRSFIVLRE